MLSRFWKNVGALGGSRLAAATEFAAFETQRAIGGILLGALSLQNNDLNDQNRDEKKFKCDDRSEFGKRRFRQIS